MKNRLLIIACCVVFMLGFGLAGCGNSSSGLEDGTYVATFTTDHPMFHVNDANNDKGILTVKDGQMTIHVSLQSKKIVNLFAGVSEDAKKDGAELIEPTVDKIDYGDGYVDEVYGFDIPVPALDEEFDVALIGTHGNWYDHKVVVSDPVPGDDIHAGSAIDLEDGDYQVETTLEGGTGKATIDSPADMTVKDGQATLTVVWSSPHYDYMIVDGEKYEPVNEDGNSVFEIPVPKLNEPFKVIGDTTAMSEPHEIEYEITCTLTD
ncbi:MAG: iron transporter [Bacillota bacterium]|nr:iron transporter [Bacillota bacterium]